jgi:putative Mg2+ transporter-C (MgtC) family protein
VRPLRLGKKLYLEAGMQLQAAAAISPAANTLSGQGWKQIGELAAALVLSAAIGLEREIRQKDAGLRTHTLVGLGAALFMLISKYGFTDVLEPRLVMLDPSRVAAQIVTGIGFLGAGLIFVHRNSVRGLTTAAAVWVTAAIGAAAGAGLVVLAAVSTGAYLLVTLAFTMARRFLPAATSGAALRIRYQIGRGTLREVINRTTGYGFIIDDLATEHQTNGTRGEPPRVTVSMHVHGKPPVSELIGALSDLEDVDTVTASDMDGEGE